MNDADRAAETQAIKRDVMNSLHCALAGTVVAFDGETCTAEIQPAIEGMPVLKDVPVFMPVSFEINAGDRCLVIFADRDITRWWTQDEDADLSPRSHSLSDGLAFVGFGGGAS